MVFLNMSETPTLFTHEPTEKFCIVLTDNYYLYYGVASCLPEHTCIHSTFTGQNAVKFACSRPLVLVDSKIFFCRAWENFSSLFERYPQGRFVWLPYGPNERYLRDDALSIRCCELSDVRTFRDAVERCSAENVISLTKRKVLSRIEEKFLACLLTGMTINETSTFLKKPTSYSYALRSKLAEIIGLNNSCHLSFHLEKISAYVLYYNVLHVL